jgi:CheY-like chemotaxis protein
LQALAVRPIQVLVVDDDRVARSALVEVLRMEGHDVVGAENGQAALRALETFAADVIVSDLNMPEMDGVTFIELARKLGRPFRAIIISASDDADNFARAVGAHFLPKPIAVAELLVLLDAWQPRRASS